MTDPRNNDNQQDTNEKFNWKSNSSFNIQDKQEEFTSSINMYVSTEGGDSQEGSTLETNLFYNYTLQDHQGKYQVNYKISYSEQYIYNDNQSSDHFSKKKETSNRSSFATDQKLESNYIFYDGFNYYNRLKAHRYQRIFYNNI
ncbi:hypothetical protein L3V83_05485 [Thiotrichales bacterium 19X7-9]|nr:hypothetical protein [Thiotrichales bacterium 19X7-9]